MSDIEEMTLYEYELKMRAYRLKRIDEELRMHQQAWLNQRVKSTDKNGKPIYREFKQFYDYEKELRALDTPKITPTMKKLTLIAKKANEGR